MYGIAIVSGGVGYGYHNKIYYSKNKAESALKTMADNGKYSEDYSVYEIRLFPIKEGE